MIAIRFPFAGPVTLLWSDSELGLAPIEPDLVQ
jgi:hypothetical protein